MEMEDELIKQKWDEVLAILKNEITEITFKTWILPLVPHALENNCFYALTGQSLALAILEKNIKQISMALSKVYGQDIFFKVEYSEELHKQIEKERLKNKKAEEKSFIEGLEKKIEDSKYDGLKKMQSSCKLNLKYKFDNFVVGASNKFAYAVSVAVAKDPGKQYNPLFIYGDSGLGKTHLLQAIGHEILFNTKLKVKYFKMEEFVNDFINSIAKGYNTPGKSSSNKEMNEFRNKYRNADVLLIDDIQFIEGKKETQNELFHTFDSFHNEGKQIVLTSDRPPEKLAAPDRLKTRFQQGIIVDVQAPDLETRMAILKKLAEKTNLNVPNIVIEFIANVYKKNIRELEGAFNTVSAYASINEIPLTVESVKKIIGYNDKKKAITIDNIIDSVAKYYDVTSDDIKGTCRMAKISMPAK